jgi:hypothetical protein
MQKKIYQRRRIIKQHILTFIQFLKLGNNIFGALLGQDPGENGPAGLLHPLPGSGSLNCTTRPRKMTPIFYNPVGQNHRSLTLLKVLSYSYNVQQLYLVVQNIPQNVRQTPDSCVVASLE